jgi:Outer membrane protein beta-barrel domain
MNKFILLATITLFSLANVQAQGIKMGVKGGVNLSNIGSSSFKSDYLFAFQGGAFFEIDFNKKVGIQPEILFSQTSLKKGVGFDSLYAGISNLASDGNVTLSYLSIPVLLRYNVNKLLTIHVGPQYSILIDKKETLLANGKSAFANGEFSIVGGLQLNLTFFRVYARYNIGLTNINDIQDKDKWQNQQLQFGIGFRF